ncbi:ABC-type oligopeptide transport system substrate-binding subunit [Priestia megaterium]|uniref:ABC transporter substrate-binding protein n=1 Tax=Priestia megaterium TaxID=1404 RepID=UPI000BF30AB2|nr:ABC transporter substrate-binding protein [Priestia megaterium]MCM3185918.1 ABC transporter substrate-binding protein [Priestia megaterium]PFK99281.1 hypothetical protein COJ01_20040 [Priestia megaterium]RCX19560.1 oligopeptide transport system substrate-binding protein [Bacillus sp. AG236]
MGKLVNLLENNVSVFIGEPTSIDPCFGSEHDGALILRFLCDPLIDFDPKTGGPRPAAAKSWSIEESGRTIRFFLREGVFFHHGREVVAEDYVYSWNRLASPTQNSELAYHLSKIEGFKEFRDGKKDYLTGIRAVNNYELEIKLLEPFTEVHALFGHHATAPVPKEIVEKDPARFKEMPISNGPYKISEPWNHNKNINMEKFDKYYGENEAFIDGGKSYIDSIEFRIYEELDDAYKDWCNGKLDITKVPPSRISEALKWDENFRKTSCALIKYLGFPTNLPPFDNVNVRKAIAIGLDRQKIIENIFAGTGPIATGILPPAIGEAYQSNPSSILTQPSNIKLAQDMLRKEGIKEVLKVPFYYNAGLGHESWVKEVKEQLRENLDIELELRPLEWGEFLTKLQNGIDGMFRMTWAIDCPSPDNILFPLFHSNSIGSDNFSLYQNKLFDQELSIARATLDHKERIDRYRRAETIVLDDMPIIPLWFGIQYHVVNLDRLKFKGNSVVDIFGEPVLRHAQIN